MDRGEVNSRGIVMDGWGVVGLKGGGRRLRDRWDVIQVDYLGEC